MEHGLSGIWTLWNLDSVWNLIYTESRLDGIWAAVAKLTEKLTIIELFNQQKNCRIDLLFAKGLNSIFS